MLKVLLFSSLMWATVGSAASADPTDISVEACIQSAVELEQLVDDKLLGPDQVDQIDGMLTEMENYCDSQQFAEAKALAGDIAGMLGQHQ
jgi:hypothetical protein